jgi:DNA segregation ATPase FtsK/SpoIIIE, S-DNA-T family
MAKKKEKKEEEKSSIYHVELTGILLLLISFVGLGSFGPAGNVIKGFAIFIAGTWYWVVLLYVLYVGVYLIINRENPNFFTSRLMGVYILFLAILILSHIKYVTLNESTTEVMKETINQLLLAFRDHYGSVDSGGGILGAIFALLFVKLFANGANVVIFTLIVFSIVMMTNISISQSVNWIIDKIKKITKRGKNKKEKIETNGEETGTDNKVVISNINELTQIVDTNEEPIDNIYKKETVNDSYLFPPVNLLTLPKKTNNDNQGVIRSNVEILERVLTDFEISGKVVQVHVGPSVTQYEVELKAGTKVNKVLSINREIALALAAKAVRIQAPIPGKNTIGIEIPNKVNTIVLLREVMAQIPNNFSANKLSVGLGMDIMGKAIFAEINKTPHLLVAGATGSGKSVCINSIIISILMRARPDEVKFLLIDPKKVELNIYNGIPHLLAPVVTDPRKASVALIKIVSEMESRYTLFDGTEVKSIAGYNQYVEDKNKKLPDSEKLNKLPYIIVIIDELADLMLVASKEVEESIRRITQMARAAGIHLIVATQRPSTDVITGIIKTNIPSRISFAVSSNVDSRTILDMGGAEKLLGKGDMLFLPMGENIPIRLQGSFISEEEVKRIVDWTIRQQKAKYDEKLVILDDKNIRTTNDKDDSDDPLYNEIVEFAVRNGKISASLVQRRYRLGYNRAARIIDILEERGIIGPQNGSKPREVLVRIEEPKEE